tara:strand:- start:106 stop:546 length:441 start_codon:yes stop_codon:yes gene_type:complete
MIILLQEELKKAMKKQDKDTVLGLRNMIGKLKARQIDKGTELNDDECIKVLKSSAKQLKESINQYNNGGREDLAKKESFELILIQKYLPEQLPNEAIQKLVQDIIQDKGFSGLQDMGKVMGIIMSQISGEADGKIVQKIVTNELNQ